MSCQEEKALNDDSRDSYVDEDGNYVYTRWLKRSNGKWEREVVAIIPFTDENRDIIILFDQDDHDCDLQERYDEENADYGFRNQIIIMRQWLVICRGGPRAGMGRR